MSASIMSNIFSAASATSTMKVPAVPKFFEAAASFLGLSKRDVQLQFRQGKSLADLATAQGKTVDALKKAMLATFAPEQQAKFAKKIDELIQSKGGFGAQRSAGAARSSAVLDIVNMLTEHLRTTPTTTQSLFDFLGKPSTDTTQTPAGLALNLLA